MAPRVAPLTSRIQRLAKGPEIRAPQSSKRLYKTKRWLKLRRLVLLRDGYACRRTGVLLVGRYPAPNSAVVDHIKPHRGDARLFWDIDNLQAVSKAYHDSEKQKLEQTGELDTW